MITDARALKSEYVPRDLYHRDGQIDHLSSLLDPTGVGWVEDVCIVGPSGTGKTTIAKYVLSRLEREVLDLRWGYVNCMSDSTTAAALHQLVRDLGLGADLSREGEPTSKAFQRLRECDDQLVAVLDEVAVLKDRPLVGLYEVPGVSVVCLTTGEEEWLASLGESARSRLGSAATVRLEKYSHAELVDILDARAVHGLVSSRVADGAIDHIADLAAGDAREAITLLRRAAMHVEETDLDELTVAVVDAVVEDAEEALRQERVRALGTHQRLLYRIIDEADSVDAGTLHARYEARCQSPKSKPSRRRYLASLKRYDLIASEGGGPGTVYRSRG